MTTTPLAASLPSAAPPAARPAPSRRIPADQLWRPVAECGRQCGCDGGPRVGRARRALRTMAGLVMLTLGVLLPWRADLLARALLRALGIRLRVTGADLAPGALLVGNHVSWLDIVVMTALSGPRARLRMVAKTEVAGWPVIGRIGRRQRTIFVDRARPRALPGTVAQVAAALREGYTVQVFPEGTTTCGPHPVPWRAAFLQAAIDAGAPVQSITLRYTHPAAGFVGDDTLVESLRRVLAARGLSVAVLLGAPRPADAPRRDLAARLSHTDAVA
ncbi:1-acyl-sn-glycerol-3-phosphate acyltransferase [Catellatospora sp. IY07-71]|uniref:lysophospholipid acyltransferase family protein n=1 Tax=Catellatospora sp. IY07-71 TaxID=2728827 RepID=UPI001BB44DD1|nr:lysophospholipid acyltransferase family protein [Catellatospora sp. IY07-71]BCJ72535.1 1-acyl-sn-glycerol-3-phosphate acyltransferase [Catellatospora sp. IY07-71]